MLDLEEGISFVKFTAPWCAPCKVLAKNIEKIKTEFLNIKFLEIDIDDNPTIAKDYKIKNVPTIIIFKDNEEISRLIGSIKIDALRKIVRDILRENAL